MGVNNVETYENVVVLGENVKRWGIILPNVVQLAREYFNCPSATWVPLED